LTPPRPVGASAATASAPERQPVEAQELSVAAQTFPHGAASLEEAHLNELDANWASLLALGPETIARHPERARISALSAAAAVQAGDRRLARMHVRQALAWGYGKTKMSELLIAGVHATIARAALAADRERKADAHFEHSVAFARLSSERRRLALLRKDKMASELRQAIDTAVKLRKGGAQPTAATAPGWLSALAQRCLAAADVHGAIDAAVEKELHSVSERAQFFMLLSDSFLSRDDRMTAVHFLSLAGREMPQADAALQEALIRKLVAMGSGDMALDLLVASGLQAEAGDPQLNAKLRETWKRLREQAAARQEHGHEVLATYLERQLPDVRARIGKQRLRLIEIGTTREDVPGQGSTRKLAEFCKRHGLEFVTVDMDPHNSQMARQTFAQLGTDHEAVTAKGEDYLAGLQGPIELVFLDAYDFDHGKHSELRQSRYERFLGSRIDEQACHRMHLECARSIVEKMPVGGVVCLDDTWRDDAGWAAKGTLAVPHLLDNGFELVEARNRAALLVRARPAGASAGA
jgi:hypothetical protein